MRGLRQATLGLPWPPLRQAKERMIGLPFMLAGVSPAFAVGWQRCFAALMIASLANFILYVPVTALVLNGGNALPHTAPAPALNARAYIVLLLLWSTTSWIGAMLMPHP